MKKLSFLLLALAIITFTACQKTEETPAKPTVEIHKPTTTMYNSGDTVWIDVHFEDEEEIEEYHIDITNKTASSSVLHIHKSHAHVKSAHIDTFVVINVTAHSDFQLEAMAINEAEQVTTVIKDFHVDL